MVIFFLIDFSSTLISSGILWGTCRINLWTVFLELQQEFGNNQLSSLNNNGNHHRKKITSGKKGTKGGGGGFTIGSEDINKKVRLGITFKKF